MGRFFIRWNPAKAYVTKTNSNRRPYVKHPADPDVKTWKTRKNAESFLSRKHPPWAADCVIVEAPSFWRTRDPRTEEEWDELATFFNEPSGQSLKTQTAVADKIISEVFAEGEPS